VRLQNGRGFVGCHFALVVTSGLLWSLASVKESACAKTMKILKILFGVLVLLAIVFVFVAPVGPVPGFIIGGSPTVAPEPWMDTSDTHEIKLSVPGTPPRVVIIWLVQHAESLYVVGSADSGWVMRIGEGGSVQMRLGGNLYDLNAARIRDGLEPVLAAYVAKYEPDYPEIVAEFPSIEDGGDLFAVFRLDRP